MAPKTRSHGSIRIHRAPLLDGDAPTRGPGARRWFSTFPQSASAVIVLRPARHVGVIGNPSLVRCRIGALILCLFAHDHRLAFDLKDHILWRVEQHDVLAVTGPLIRCFAYQEPLEE